MRCPSPIRAVASVAVVTVFAQPAAAQTAGLTPAQRLVGCAVPAQLGVPAVPVPRVVGSQDPSDRTVFGPDDLLVIDSGPTSLAPGEEYFVRRPITYDRLDRDVQSHGIKTSGWVRIVAVEGTTAIADVEQSCDSIETGDYLEPFVAPEIPAGLFAEDRTGEPDFDARARFVFGDEERETAGAGEFMLIDQGTEQGLAIGSRFAVYRDKRTPGLPLAPIGEAIAVATSPTLAVLRIVSARDAVVSGDLAVPRRRP